MDNGINLNQIYKLLDTPLPIHKNLTAVLLDEEDEQGPIKLVDEHGNTIIVMPRNVYNELINYGPRTGTGSSERGGL